MRYTRHKRMINGDAGVKNGIFIPGVEKIWRRNGIREKRKKDPYNISEERITRKNVIQIQVKGGIGGQNIRHVNSWFSCRFIKNILHHIHSKIAQFGLNLKVEMIILQWRYEVSEFIDELLMINVTPIGRRKRIDRKIKDKRIIFIKRRVRMSSGTTTTILFNMIVCRN
ncbi:hypothetical protein Tco_1116496 [Tanacetum coccineum]